MKQDALTFDIGGTPPTAEEIGREKARLSARKRRVTAWIWAAAVMTLVVIGGGLWSGAVGVAGAWAMAVMVIVAGAVAIAADFGPFPDDILAMLARLEPIAKEDCVAIAAWAARRPGANERGARGAPGRGSKRHAGRSMG